MPRLVTIGLIWLGCAAAWWVLGSSLALRSSESTESRGKEVHGLWGGPLESVPPSASYRVVSVREDTKTVEREGERPVTTTTQYQEESDVRVPIQASDLRANFSLDHRKRGLLWFATYVVDFHGAYTFTNPSDRSEDIQMALPLDPTLRTYDGLRIADGDGQELPFEISEGTVRWRQSFGPGETQRTQVSFRTRGTETWTYLAAPGVEEARDFRLVVTTDFPNADFPTESVSPTQHDETAMGWRGEWAFDSLVTSSPLGIRMPEKLNPGPLAARITFFAPVSLLFFFFVIAMLSVMSKKELHPMHYFLLGCGFFAFHLLFAYSVDHLSLAASFLLAALVSMTLVVTYVRLFVGWRFALRTVAPTQLVYLVLFSASFFWEGFTGLSITVGAILTLFAVMQLTGRINWDEAFAKRALRPAVP